MLRTLSTGWGRSGGRALGSPTRHRKLQHAGLIRYTHGKITIIDRSGLESASCECYEVAREQFDGLLRSVSGADESGKP